MTKIIFIIFLYTLIIYSQENKGIISIDLTNDNSVVIINDSLKFYSSFKKEFPFGDYKLIAKENKNEWGSEFQEYSFTLSEQNNYFDKKINIDNKVFIDSYPSDAEVTVNDSTIGYTPLSVSLSSQNILITKENYNPQKLISPKEINYVKLESNFVKENKSFLETYLFETLIGTAVALGATAAYFKIQADNKYDEYIKSRDKSLLDQTEKLDLISGTAFGLLQINIGALIYFFLNDN